MSMVMKDAPSLWTELRHTLQELDPVGVCDLMADAAVEHVRWHEQSLSLVASRNLLSPRARAMMASGLMERVTGGGWVGERRKSGNAMIDRIEAILVLLASKLFRAEWVEYRMPTGSIANAVFVLAATKPGDTVMALSPKHGGHPTYGVPGYGGAHALRISDLPCLEDDTVEIDLEKTAQEAKRLRPKWIFLGSSRPLFPYPLRELSEIAASVGAGILYDSAHILGLWAGGQFQDPLGEGARVITDSTHKTFPGPVGGLILTNDRALAERLRGFTTIAIGNYHNNRAAALAVTLAEMQVFAADYAEATVGNARALAEALDAEGFKVVGKSKGYTQSHVVLLDLSRTMDATEAWKRLEGAKIACEPNPLPSTYPKAAALRLGSPGLTRRGMGPGEMAEVARFVRRAIVDREDPGQVGKDVEDLSSRFTQVCYCL